MANIRHVVVIRKDLNLSAGLMSAQTAHISDAFMRDIILSDKEFTNVEKDWFKNPYISVLSVDNIEELQLIISDAKTCGLQVYEWFDIIPSKNLNKPIPDVLIGCSIGPDDFDKIKSITGTLPLA